MQTAARQEALLRFGTANAGFNYRWEHVKAVVTVAKKLAKLTGADSDVVEAAAWLHDIAKIKGEKHPRVGAKIAKQLLLETDFPPKKINQVAKAIADHQGLWLKKPLASLESQLLWDADKLTKLGVSAGIHITGMLITKGVDDTQAIIDQAGNTDWMKRTIRSMHTKPARKAAKARLKRHQAFWQAIEQELNGDDLA